MQLRALIVGVMLVFTTGVSGSAQEATPDAGADGVSPAPAHLHTGTCAEPGETRYTLADAGYGLPVAVEAQTSLADASQAGSAAANAAMVSVTAVESTLDQLVADTNAIDVHRPATGQAAATRIVCGVVGGFRAGDDLVFGLEEANGSRYGGTAWLRDNGDGSTTITLFLVSGLVQGGNTAAMPGAVATPAVADSRRVEQASLIVRDGAFAASVLTLAEDVPTVLNIYNNDDQTYYFRMGDLVTTVALPANQLTTVEVTTPTAGEYAAMLLQDEDEAVGLDLLSVAVR